MPRGTPPGCAKPRRMQPSWSALGRAAAGIVAVAFACAPQAGRATDKREDLRILPAPLHATVRANCAAAAPTAGLRAPADLDEGARELVNERWSALGIPPLRSARPGTAADLRVRIADGGAAESYRLRATPAEIEIVAADRDGAFYGMATLAQLARRTPSGYALPCVEIRDEPALRRRVLSDDVSRGPLPTMRYFKERIRTIAAFKMNGWSPYMEDVFVSERRPLLAATAADGDGITAAQLRELDAYARRFHVALIPEQQTFAHMHGVLARERYAPLAETPHGWLLSPANPAGERLVREIVDDELAAIARPTFFHIGSDEPIDLGRDASAALVARDGEGPVYVRHVATIARALDDRGIRPMIWDDAIAAHPELFAAVPRSLVFVNWHYGREATYAPYIRRIARAGFAQMIAPGALNWNAIYPDLAQAQRNIDLFAREGKAAHVLGIFQTVWHDDGETLFESTWYPALYAAASGWEANSVAADRYARDFPRAFFGREDAGATRDFAELAAAGTELARFPAFSGDALFRSDPLDAAVAAHGPDAAALAAIRSHAEAALEHLHGFAPPLHGGAAAAMELAARRYDALGRAGQIAREARGLYDEARERSRGGRVRRDARLCRDLDLVKYLFRERRETLLGIEPLAAQTWTYENRPFHEASVLATYRRAADRATDEADAVDRATRLYAAGGAPLPAFERLFPLADERR